MKLRCTSCSKSLLCDCTPQPIDSVAKPCAKKKGAIWVHVTDDEGKPVPKATVLKDGVGTPTKKNGIAAFDPLDAGPYAIDFGPLGAIAEDYDPPSGKTDRQFDLADGEVAYIAYELTRKADLTVKVIIVGTENSDETPFPNAKVTVKRDGKRVEETSNNDGLAKFGKQSAGTYTIDVDAGEAGGHRYELATGNPSQFELSPGVSKDDVVLKVLKPWVAVRLEHPNGDVATGAAMKLKMKLPNGEEKEKTLAQGSHTADGFIKCEYFPGGPCEVWFPEIDDEMWEPATDPAQPAKYMPCPWEKAPGTPYTIQEGDCVRSLAARFGLPEKYIWEHPDNATLRDKYKKDAHGDTLMPKETIKIPEPRAEKKVKADAGQQHRFVLKVEPQQMKVRLLRGSKEIAGTDCVVKIDGISDQTPKTTAEGWLTFDIPPAATKATIKVGVEHLEEFTFTLGRLPPVESVIGVQHRLANLGLYAGTKDGLKSDEYDKAVETFQKWRGLALTGSNNSGQVSPETQDKLVEACGA